MKKWLLVALFVLAASPLWAQNTYLYGGSPNDTGKAFRGFAQQLGTFRIEYSNLELHLQILTRGTNDSLTVVVQTRASTDIASDTGWATLRTFGGTGTGLVAAGFKSWIRFGGISNDTLAVQPLWTFARIMVNHGDASASSLAADSSRFRLLVRNYGERFGR